MENLKLSENEKIINKSEYSGCMFEEKDIAIPDSVKIIDDFAFMNSNLTTIKFSESLERIGIAAFFNSGLNQDEISFPSKLKKIGDGAFKKTSLRKVILSEKISEIGYSAFRNAGLENVIISDSVRKIGEYAFADNNTLNNVIIGSGIKKIEKFLFANTGIETITIPEGVTEIGDYAFSGCKNLKTVILPDSLKKIRKGAFADCSKLSITEWSKNITDIDDKAFKNTAVTFICLSESTKVASSAFENSPVDKVILNPDDKKNIILRDHMLLNKRGDMICNLNKKIFTVPKKQKDILSIPNRNIVEEIYIHSGIKTIPFELLVNCPNLRIVSVSEDNKNYFSYNGGVYTKHKAKKSKTELLFVAPSVQNFEIRDDVEVIGEYAFRNNKTVKNIQFSDNVIINEGAFDNSELLELDNGIYYIGSLGYAIADYGIVKIRKGTTELTDWFFLSKKDRFTLDKLKNMYEDYSPFCDGCDANHLTIEALYIPSGLKRIKTAIFKKYFYLYCDSDMRGLKSVFFTDSFGKEYACFDAMEELFVEEIENVLQYMNENDEKKAQDIWKKYSLDKYLKIQ